MSKYTFSSTLFFFFLTLTTLLAQHPSAIKSFEQVSEKPSTIISNIESELPPPFRLGHQDVLVDKKGLSHYRVDVLLHGYPIKGRQYTIHELENSQTGLIEPSLPHSRLVKPLINYNSSSLLNRTISILNDSDYELEREKLVWVPAGFDWSNTSTFVLVNQMDLHHHRSGEHLRVYISVEEGNVIFTEDRTCTLVPGTAVTRYSGKRAVETDLTDNGAYRLLDNTRGNGIHTRRLGGKEYYDANNYWDNSNPDLDEVAGDVHWGLAETYDWFSNNFNRNSFDNQGMKIDAYIQDDFANALWNGSHVIFGEGVVNSDYDLPLTSIDIVAHELGHGMTEFASDLIYAGEPGGLNEAFSDIVGMGVQSTAAPEQMDWILGNDFSSKGEFFRIMSNPKIKEMPDTYEGEYWNENLEVHSGSSIANYWFYLLAEGDVGTNDLGDNYDIEPIGMDTAQMIVYHAWTYYASAGTDYHQMASLTLAATTNLYGCGSVLDRVVEAWAAVGIEVNEISGINANRRRVCSFDDPVEFNYFGTLDAITWDFGDGFTSNEASPTHYYTTPGKYDVTAIGTSCTDTFNLKMFGSIVVTPGDASCDTTLVSEGAFGPINKCNGVIAAGYNGSDPTPGRVVISNPGADGYLLEAKYEDANSATYTLVYSNIDGVPKLVGSFNSFSTTPITIPGSEVILEMVVVSEPLGVNYAINWSCLTATQPVADFSYLGNSSGCRADIRVIDASINFPSRWAWYANGELVSTAQQGLLVLPQANTLYDLSLEVCNAVGCDTMTVEGLYYYDGNPSNCGDLNMSILGANSSLCSGKLYDSGGPNGNYSSGHHQSNLFIPDAENVLLEFAAFDLNDNDTLFISGSNFNGSNIFLKRYGSNDLKNQKVLIEGNYVLIGMRPGGTNTGAEGFEMSWSCQLLQKPSALFVQNGPICEGRLEFTNQSTGNPSSLTWLLNGELAALGQYPIIDQLEAGIYDVTLIACNDKGCDTLTMPEYIDYDGTDDDDCGLTRTTEESIKKTIKLYPNPNTNIAYLKTDGLLTGLWEIKVLNTLGQIVEQRTIDFSLGIRDEQIDVSSYKQGLYIISGRSLESQEAFSLRGIKI